MKKEYKFDPKEFGFESVDNFPELECFFPMGTDKYFVKVTAFREAKDLAFGAYWYKVIYVYFEHGDDRIKIYSGSYLCNPIRAKSNSPSIDYFGLIPSKKFANKLLCCLMGTTVNKSVKIEGVERLKTDRNIKVHELLFNRTIKAKQDD